MVINSKAEPSFFYFYRQKIFSEGMGFGYIFTFLRCCVRYIFRTAHQKTKFSDKVKGLNGSDSIENEQYPPHGLATILEKPCVHKIMGHFG